MVCVVKSSIVHCPVVMRLLKCFLCIFSVIFFAVTRAADQKDVILKVSRTVPRRQDHLEGRNCCCVLERPCARSASVYRIRLSPVFQLRTVDEDSLATASPVCHGWFEATNPLHMRRIGRLLCHSSISAVWCHSNKICSTRWTKSKCHCPALFLLTWGKCNLAICPNHYITQWLVALSGGCLNCVILKKQIDFKRIRICCLRHASQESKVT